MNLKQTARIIMPDESNYANYEHIKTVACSNVLTERDRDSFGQKTYKVFLAPSYGNLNNQHHLIIENTRYAIQDIERLPHDVPKAIVVTVVLYDAIGNTLGDEEFDEPEVDWWEAGGATGAVAVYQPKGANSYLMSLSDLSGNENHATEVIGPNWTAANGWVFGGTEYLMLPVDVGINYPSYSAVTKIIDASNGYAFGSYLKGALFTPNRGFAIAPGGSGNTTFYQGGYGVENGPRTEGIFAVSNQKGYINGAMTTTIGTETPNTLPALTIGALNRSDIGPSSMLIGTITALALYENPLTDDQIAAISAAMLNI